MKKKKNKGGSEAFKTLSEFLKKQEINDDEVGLLKIKVKKRKKGEKPNEKIWHWICIDTNSSLFKDVFLAVAECWETEDNSLLIITRDLKHEKALNALVKEFIKKYDFDVNIQRWSEECSQ